MTRWVILTPATVEPESVGDISTYPEMVAGRPGVHACSAGPELPGSVGGLGATWDLTADVAPASVLPELSASADAVPLLPVAARTVALSGPRVKRTMLFTVRPGTPQNVVEQLGQAEDAKRRIRSGSSCATPLTT